MSSMTCLDQVSLLALMLTVTFRHGCYVSMSILLFLALILVPDLWLSVDCLTGIFWDCGSHARLSCVSSLRYRIHVTTSGSGAFPRLVCLIPKSMHT